MNRKKLIREQLQSTLLRFKPLSETEVPHKGWIRAIRDALGMTAKQLARRLGVTQQSVARIEKDELTGAVTIKTMRRIAERLECSFVYGFVPHTSLDDTLRKQAGTVASRQLEQANQTMSLEAQSLTSEENRQILAEMVENLMETLPSNLWDEV